MMDRTRHQLRIVGDQLGCRLTSLYLLKKLGNQNIRIEASVTPSQTVKPLAFNKDIKTFFLALGITDEYVVSHLNGSPFIGYNYQNPAGKYTLPMGSYSMHIGRHELHQLYLNALERQANIPSYDQFTISRHLIDSQRFTPPSPRKDSAFYGLDYGFVMLSDKLLHDLGERLKPYNYVEQSKSEHGFTDSDLNDSILIKLPEYQDSGSVKTRPIQPSLDVAIERQGAGWVKRCTGEGWSGVLVVSPARALEANSDDKRADNNILDLTNSRESILFDRYYIPRKAVEYLMNFWAESSGLSPQAILSTNTHISKISEKIRLIDLLHDRSDNKNISGEIEHRVHLFNAMGKIPLEENALLDPEQWVHLMYAMGYSAKTGAATSFGITPEESINTLKKIHQAFNTASQTPTKLVEFVQSVKLKNIQ